MALDECGRRVKRGEGLARCLEDYPAEYRDELARLVPLAGRMAHLGQGPSPEFRARLEGRLLASLDDLRQTRRGGAVTRMRRLFGISPLVRFAALALVALAIFAGSGIGVIHASENSLPDSPLYQVKTAREWAELALARNEEARVGVHALQIPKRGRDLRLAVQTRKARPMVESLAQRLTWSVERIVDQALELRGRGNPAPAARAQALVRRAQRQVGRLMAQAPPEAQPALQRLRSVLEAQERRLVSQ
ncbi:MAG: hypothetical protein HY675_17095 [Chloroflexi bacterium]|nr:hypothetical protein [Chloroflexota bacterium]